ncbi:MAG: thioredoxin domain-containing protein [Chloroflexi bacterium]|nr:thioredoxin domain-containing protein [Chloroflexota bacterium]
MANRLAKETSPYLLQHKDNPVDWFPWGEEAFEKARAEDKPIFLSIGYSACHWCHVMEHESFEDEATAKLMNAEFVSIKVDREERPDVDSIYMAAVQAMTGSGGWPMSIFMTNDARPFFAGTYFPPEPRSGMPSFTQLLESLSEAYRSRRDEVIDSSSRIVAQLVASNQAQFNETPLDRRLIERDMSDVLGRFDPENGGFGGAPKFPQPMVYEYLLRVWSATGDDAILDMVSTTLTRMAKGGMYDQIGGGFHRYSVDPIWLVPHFEKMLYDNALLVPLYLHAYQATGDEFFKSVAVDVLDYVRREMLHPQGGFYSAQDADSEGVEGKFFVWEASEFANVLGEEVGVPAAAYWSATSDGNFEGKNILWVPRDDSEVADELGMSVCELLGVIRKAREKLFEAREQRVKPGLDDKVLTSWNALMQRAFALAGAVFERPDYVEIAVNNASFLIENVRHGDRILRTWKDSADGGNAHLNGYLEDYSFQVESLISLYEATFDDQWLIEARTIANRMIDLFWDGDAGVFHDTGTDHEELLVRPRDVFDNATPSGGSVAATVLLKLALIFDDDEYRELALRSLGSVRDLMEQAPLGLPNWLAAVDFHTGRPKEVVVIGALSSAETRSLLRTAHAEYMPNLVLAGAPGQVEHPISPLLESRALVDGEPAAYVCENYVCQLPVTEPEALAELLDHS